MSFYKRNTKIPFFTPEETRGLSRSFLEEDTLPALAKSLRDINTISRVKESQNQSTSPVSTHLLSGESVLNRAIKKIESILQEAKKEKNEDTSSRKLGG